VNLAPRSYGWAGAVVVVGITGQWAGWLWSGAWLVLALPWVAALAREYRASRASDLVAERRCREPLRLGRTETGGLTVTNRGPGTAHIELELPEPIGVALITQRYTMAVAAEASDTITFPIEARALGPIEWPAVAGQRLGRWGLAWWPYRPAAPLSARVVPDTLADRAVASGHGRAGPRRSAAAGDGVELTGLRAYAPGDPLRSIAWKATARRGKPMVKLFSHDEQLDLVVCIDAGRRARLAAGSLTRFGHAVNAAAQLVERSVRNDDRAGVLVFADRVLAELPPGHGTGHVLRARRLLGSLEPVARESNPLVAALGVRRLVGQRGLVVFITDLEEAEAAGQLAQATQLLAPKHLPLIGTIDDPEQRLLMQAPPDNWMAPYRRLAAQELERDRDLTARRLRRTGAVVVSADPTDLGDRLLNRYHALRRRRAV